MSVNNLKRFCESMLSIWTLLRKVINHSFLFSEFFAVRSLVFFFKPTMSMANVRRKQTGIRTPGNVEVPGSKIKFNVGDLEGSCGRTRVHDGRVSVITLMSGPRLVGSGTIFCTPCIRTAFKVLNWRRNVKYGNWSEQNDELFPIQKIIGTRVQGDKKQYLVKWQGYEEP